MHSVKRVEEPDKLREKKAEWTQRYLELIESGSDSKDRYPRGKYNHREIKAALKEMYGACCCYCEGNVDPTSSQQVEHYRPKSKFPDLTFEWSNLHYCCPKCNISKSDKWDEENPILNPVDDVPEEHLFFDKYFVVFDKADIRAKNTVEQVGLNRDGLIEYRASILKKVMEFFQSHKNSVVDKETLKAMLKDAVNFDNSFVSFRKYVNEEVVESLFKSL